MHILLFGKNGQIGWELQRALSVLGQITALSHDSNGLCGDFLNPNGIINTIRTVKPHVIVNATGYTAVDLAEKECANAEKINATTVKVIAQEAKNINALFVHYSSDYVFDGEGNVAWTESDEANPLNFYGKTKLAGEQFIQQFCNKYLIFRTSWVYSLRGSNFFKSIVKLSQEKETIAIVNDQFGAPTSAEMLADCTLVAIYRTLLDPSLSGLYHVCAAGTTSWHDYGLFIIEHLGRYPEKLKVQQINAIASSAYPQAALRPKNSSLNTEKFRSKFDVALPAWQIGVERILNEYFYINNSKG